jgi:hypothetical protein
MPTTPSRRWASRCISPSAAPPAKRPLVLVAPGPRAAVRGIAPGPEDDPGQPPAAPARARGRIAGCCPRRSGRASRAGGRMLPTPAVRWGFGASGRMMPTPAAPWGFGAGGRMMPAPVRSSFEAGGRALPTPVELCHEPVRPQARGAGRRRPGKRKLDRSTLLCVDFLQSALLCGAGRPASDAEARPSAANSAVPQPLAVSSSVRLRPAGIRGAPDAEARPSCGQLCRASASCGQLFCAAPAGRHPGRAGRRSSTLLRPTLPCLSLLRAAHFWLPVHATMPIPALAGVPAHGLPGSHGPSSRNAIEPNG